MLCVGRIDPVKNQSWLVDQVPEYGEEHPHFMLALAGPCADEAYGAALKPKSPNWAWAMR